MLFFRLDHRVLAILMLKDFIFKIPFVPNAQCWRPKNKQNNAKRIIWIFTISTLIVCKKEVK